MTTQPMLDALASFAAFRLLGLEPASRRGEAVHFFFMDTAKIFALLILVIYVMGLLRAMLPPERVRDRPDWQARGMAVTLGTVTPFCSCSSVPLFIGFAEAGIPLGVTFSFLIANPMINKVAAAILIGILGWKLAALYVAAGLLVAWVGGIAMQAFRPERWAEDVDGVFLSHIRGNHNPGLDRFCVAIQLSRSTCRCRFRFNFSALSPKRGPCGHRLDRDKALRPGLLDRSDGPCNRGAGACARPP